MAGLARPPLDLPGFTRRLACARAGIYDPEDPEWVDAIALGGTLPDDMLGAFLLVARAAKEGKPCPSDSALAATYGTSSLGRCAPPDRLYRKPRPVRDAHRPVGQALDHHPASGVDDRAGGGGLTRRSTPASGGCGPVPAKPPSRRRPGSSRGTFARHSTRLTTGPRPLPGWRVAGLRLIPFGGPPPAPSRNGKPISASERLHVHLEDRLLLLILSRFFLRIDMILRIALDRSRGPWPPP